MHAPGQDAHKDTGGKAPRRKRKFGPMDTKHTVTSVVWLQQDHVVASSGAPPLPVYTFLRMLPRIFNSFGAQIALPVWVYWRSETLLVATTCPCDEQEGRLPK